MRSKIVTQTQAAALRKKLHRQGKTVIFTNGCFDIIHAGHARYLASAKRLGDFLIVGLNTDKSVRRLKGKGRPIMTFNERALLLSFLNPVDLVVGFSADTPEKIINLLRPDVLVKGADYRQSEIVGANEVKSWGGIVRRIPLSKGKSTSNLIKRLMGQYR